MVAATVLETITATSIPFVGSVPLISGAKCLGKKSICVREDFRNITKSLILIELSFLFAKSMAKIFFIGKFNLVITDKNGLTYHEEF